MCDVIAARPRLQSMGAAVVALWTVQDRVAVAHAGDCRAFAVRGGALRPITADHTLAERMRDEHGRLRAHLSLFVNQEDARFLGGEDATLADGDIVLVLAALSGG